MKKTKSLRKTQRKSLDQKLKAFAEARKVIPPNSGWLRALREALGMSTTQLAQRMGIQQSGVTLLEQREVSKKVSLETLERAARAMNCELVYALVPKVSLEQIVDEQAQRAAREILSRSLHSMALEMQKPNEAEGQLHLEEMAADIKAKLDRRLWSPK